MKTTKTKPASNPDTKTLIVITTSKIRKITVPASAKVTLSPLVPSSKGNYGGDAGVALRIYRNATEQIAVIRNVIEFWDESIPIFELACTVEGVTSFVKSGDAEKSSSDKKITRAWISANP